jgi:membrane protein YdbS with pleckstrin-like domain
VVRKGIIGVDHILMPAFKIQEVGRVRTPLMKRHNLSTLSFSSASRNVTVPFLPDSMVREVIDYCLYETESTGRSWM